MLRHVRPSVVVWSMLMLSTVSNAVGNTRILTAYGTSLTTNHGPDQRTALASECNNFGKSEMIEDPQTGEKSCLCIKGYGLTVTDEGTYKCLACNPGLAYSGQSKDCRCYYGDKLVDGKGKEMYPGVWIPDLVAGCRCSIPKCAKLPGMMCKHEDNATPKQKEDYPDGCECDPQTCTHYSMMCRPNKQEQVLRLTSPKGKGKGTKKEEETSPEGWRPRRVCGCRYGYKQRHPEKTCVCDELTCEKNPGMKCSDDKQFCQADAVACGKLEDEGRWYNQNGTQAACMCHSTSDECLAAARDFQAMRVCEESSNMWNVEKKTCLLA